MANDVRPRPRVWLLERETFLTSHAPRWNAARCRAKSAMKEQRRVIWLDRLRMSDVAQVGGKNASLGEMIGELRSEGIRVPGGFATTAFAFHEFLEQDGLATRIDRALATLDVDDVTALARTGEVIR